MMFIIYGIIIATLFGVAISFLFKKQFGSKVFPISIISSILLGLLVSAIYLEIYKNSVTKDIEYWNNIVVAAEYYESYETYVSQTCTETYACGSHEENGQTVTDYCTRTYDCSYCDSYKERYYKVLNDATKIEISRTEYNYLVKRFSAIPKFVELNRNIHYYGGCGKDGDKYTAYWDGKIESSINYVRQFSYENKVKNSNSVYKFEKIQERDSNKIYKYPEINLGKQQKILGKWRNNLDLQKSEQYLQYFSGLFGKDRQLNIYFLLYNNKPKYYYQLQKNYLENGNKNEYILCINYDDSIITSCDIITWCEVNSIKSKIKQYIQDNPKVTLEQLTWYVTGVLKNDWKRKDFKDFDYINIEITQNHYLWLLLTLFIIYIILPIIILFINNRNKTYYEKYRRL